MITRGPASRFAAQKATTTVSSKARQSLMPSSIYGARICNRKYNPTSSALRKNDGRRLLEISRLVCGYFFVSLSRISSSRVSCSA